MYDGSTVTGRVYTTTRLEPRSTPSQIRSRKATLANFYAFAKAAGYRAATLKDLRPGAILLRVDAEAYMRDHPGRPFRFKCGVGRQIKLDESLVIRHVDDDIVYYRYHYDYTEGSHVPQSFDSIDAVLAADYRDEPGANRWRYLTQINTDM